MKKFTFLLVLLISSTLMYGKIAVGYYYANYTAYPHTAIDYEKLTHIAHAFITTDSNGNLRWDSWFPYPALITEAHKHNVKIIVALGGFGNCAGFSGMVASEENRDNFIDNIVKFCKDNGYDGIDLDWEYPKSADKANFALLVSELRKEFTVQGLEIISAALPSSDWNDGYDIAKLKNDLDWFGIMTYDFTGPWEKNSGHNSPLYKNPKQYGSADESLRYYLNKGVPKEKLCIGMAFYGYSFDASGPFVSGKNGKSISYVNANKLKNNGYEYHWDEYSKVPFLQNNSHTKFVSYDDTNSIKLKCEYVHKNQLGGAIIWKIGFDYANGENPLLNTVKKYLYEAPSSAPGVITLSLPANNGVIDSNYYQLEWNPAGEATSYSLEVSKEESFGTKVVSKSGLTYPAYSYSKFEDGATYYWRVKGKNLVGEGEWSEVRSFKTKFATGVEEISDLIPGDYKVANYPNPFNPVTKIRYAIPEKGLVTLAVYNILGQKVADLLNKELSAGTYETDFNGSNLSSGTYICILNSNGYTKTTKLLLIK